MERVLVNITVHTANIPDLQTLLPGEAATADKWKQDGILEHFFMKTDGSGVVMLFRDVEQSGVKDLIPTLPLSKYFEKVEYLTLQQQF